LKNPDDDSSSDDSGILLNTACDVIAEADTSIDHSIDDEMETKTSAAAKLKQPHGFCAKHQQGIFVFISLFTMATLVIALPVWLMSAGIHRRKEPIFV
jgi:hypothetical protein